MDGNGISVRGSQNGTDHRKKLKTEHRDTDRNPKKQSIKTL